MRVLLLMLITLLAAGCTKQPVGAWLPEQATTTPGAESLEVIPPPENAILPKMTFPLYVQDAQGRETEPITLVVAATEAQLAGAFEKAGWVAAEPLSEDAIARARTAQRWNEPYPNAPVAPLYYWGREQDAAWQRPGRSYAERVRVRVWRSETQDAEGRWLFALNVAEDAGFLLVPSHGLPIHHMLSTVDAATQTLIADFTKTGLIRQQYMLYGIGVNSGFRTAAGEPYKTSGYVHVLEF